MKLNVLTILAVFAVLFTACDNDDEDDPVDTTAPQISEIKVNEEDHDIMVKAGSEMHLDVELSDNEALGELKIDIHDIFDGHSHDKNNQKYSVVRTVDLSGKTQKVHEHFDIPEATTAGPYHAICRVIDAEGNEGEFKEIEFMISNGNEAQVNIVNPDFSDEAHADKGSTLSIEGTITDETDIAEIVIELKEEHDHDGHSHGRILEEELYDADFDLDGPSDTSWDFQADGNVNIDIPSDVETGHYMFMVKVMDSDGNMTIFEEEIHIH